jgi:uncharacterized surface protein with fasciclin (FAS1) repeats
MLSGKVLLASMAAVVAAQDLSSTLSMYPSLSNLTTYLKLYPEILSNLNSLSNFTLLAPSNMAFQQALNSSTGAAFTSNDQNTISALLSYHVVNGSYDNFSTIPEFCPTALLPGNYANVSGGQVVEIISSSNMSLPYASVYNASMSNATMSNSTRSSPNVTILSGYLHNSSIVSNGTFNVSGGVVHIVNSFLQIPSNLTNTAVQLGLRSAVGALTTVNLAQQLDTMMNMTFFIPTNEAFQAVGGTLATMSPTELSRILAYHVINGTVGYSTMLNNGSMLATADNNVPVTITKHNGTVYVNSAKVVVPNVLVANGVVHVIDAVLNPGNRTASVQTASTAAPAFSDASSVSGTPFTSGVASATTSINTGAVESAVASQTSGSRSSSSSGAAVPVKTGAIGAAALFGGLAAFMNA